MAGENPNNLPPEHPKKLEWWQRGLQSLKEVMAGVGKVIGFFLPKAVKGYLKRLVTIMGFRQESENIQDGAFPPPPKTTKGFQQSAGRVAEQEVRAEEEARIQAAKAEAAHKGIESSRAMSENAFQSSNPATSALDKINHHLNLVTDDINQFAKTKAAAAAAEAEKAKAEADAKKSSDKANTK